MWSLARFVENISIFVGPSKKSVGYASSFHFKLDRYFINSVAYRVSVLEKSSLRLTIATFANLSGYLAVSALINHLNSYEFAITWCKNSVYRLLYIISSFDWISTLFVIGMLDGLAYGSGSLSPINKVEGKSLVTSYALNFLSR